VAASPRTNFPTDVRQASLARAKDLPPTDRPLSVRESLHGLLAVFRLMDRQLDIDLDATAIRFNVAGRADVLVSLTLADLIRRADAAVAAADMAAHNADVPGQHSPLPWGLAAEPDENTCLVAYDATGEAALLAGHGLPDTEALATIVYAMRAANAFPLLLETVRTATHALRSYQYGNSAPDFAREIADACEAVVAQMEGR